MKVYKVIETNPDQPAERYPKKKYPTTTTITTTTRNETVVAVPVPNIKYSLLGSGALPIPKKK